jgi:PAS domain S-box-containing protein
MDTSILLTANALLSFAAAVTMLVTLRTGKTYPGFGLWTAGIACLALGAAMLVPGALPSTGIVRLARNALLVCGHVLFLRGLIAFRGERLGWWFEVLVALAFLAVFGWYNVEPADLGPRIVIYSVFAGALSAATAYLTLRRRPEYFGSSDVLLALWLSVYALLALVRAMHQLAGSGSGTAFESTGSSGVYYALAQILTAQLLPLTFIAMNSQRIAWQYRTGEARLRTLIQTLPDLVWLKDINGAYLACNRRFEQFFGAGEAEIIGRTDRDFVSPERAEFFRARDLEAVAAGGPTTNEEEITFAMDGHRELLQTIKTPVFGETGQLMGVLGVGRDITKLRESEGELLAHRNRLEELVQERTHDLQQANRRLADTEFAMDRVGIGIHWVDAETGRFVYVNQAAATMLGYTIEEMLGMSVPDIDPAYAADFRRETEVIRDRGFIRSETQVRYRDGRMIPAEATIYWQPDAGGGGRFIAFMVDISERKRIEEDMRQAKVAAETATIAKSAFLANMSHEIRTPMNGILGMAYLVRRGGVTARQADQLDKVAGAGQHLLAIINDVLDLAKIESGRFDLADTVFARDDLVRGVSSLVAESATAKGLEFTVDLDSLPSRLRGDRTRLEQALVNYVGNAIKFTERGSIRLRGTMFEETADEVRLKFEVHDTGIGIPAAELGRLFIAFQQVDQSSTRRAGGTGLGLAITKHIAAAMGGEVGVESVPGEGSTFWLTVRLRKADEPEAGVAILQISPGTLLARHHAGVPVLVVDDEDLNREVACELLREVGLAPESAAGGQEAVRKAQAHRYRVILMDVKMPGMDGLMAARAIRALPTGGEVPIVAVTANVYAEDRRACLDAGMNDFVAKPLEPEKLYATLLECLGPQPKKGDDR